jgi:cob(I)alamin adenosyltransferase
MTPEEKLKRIENIVRMAECWCEEQIMPEGQICMAALKDVRTVVRSK